MLVFLLAGCGGRTISGTFVLTQAEFVQRSSPTTCAGTGGYSDISPGLGVVVKDDKGAIVGTDVLVAAPIHDSTKDPNEYLQDSRRCTYTFAFRNVPDVSFYSVEVGHRGEVTYSRADLEAAGWAITTRLGG